MSRQWLLVPWLLGLLGALSAPETAAASSQRDSQASALIHSVDVLGLIGNPVTDANWEQVARIDRVLFDPADGRATFVVLSFADRDERIAVPWDALSIDELGQARLKSPRHAIDNALRFYGDRASVVSARPTPYRADSGELPRIAIASEQEGWIQGRVMGRLTMPSSRSDGRRVLMLVESGARTFRIDLGSQETLDAAGLEIAPGEWIQVQGSFASEAAGVFLADAVRSGTNWVNLHPSGGGSASRE